mgnify:CR=1 FL=1
MKLNSIQPIFTFLTAAALTAAGFVSCSPSDIGDVSGKKQVRIVLSPGSQEQPAAESATRAGISPQGQRFDGYSEAHDFPEGTTMGVVFSTSKQVTDSYSGYFTYSDSSWTSGVNAEANTDYTVYGLIPYDCCSKAEYDMANGTINLTGVVPVSNADVSVIVGVGSNHYWNAGKTGPNMTGGKINGAFPCNFKYHTTDDEENLLCILLDHIFVQSRFHFNVDADYSRLRDIYIHGITLSTPQISALNAEISLDTANTDHSKTTAIKSIEWSGAVSGSSPKTEIYRSDSGCKLAETPTLAGTGYFPPNAISALFRIEVEYDVRDKQGTTTRTGQVAVNSFISNSTAILPGHLYDVYITVAPTYLYRLSDYDLDNPTLTMTY